MPKFDPKPSGPTKVRNDSVSMRLTPEMKERFYSLCEERGIKPNALLRQCVEFALGNI